MLFLFAIKLLHILGYFLFAKIFYAVYLCTAALGSQMVLWLELYLTNVVTKMMCNI